VHLGGRMQRAREDIESGSRQSHQNLRAEGGIAAAVPRKADPAIADTAFGIGAIVSLAPIHLGGRVGVTPDTDRRSGVSPRAPDPHEGQGDTKVCPVLLALGG
jgi:hypothetical protein